MSPLFAFVALALRQDPTPQVVDKSVRLRPHSGPLAGQTVYTGTFSLFVGIGDYRNDSLPKIKCAPNDARTMRKILVEKYGFEGDADHCTVLTDAEATKSRIDQEIARLCDSNRIKPTDRVFVYFSCHGQGVPLSDGSKVGYVLPYDATVSLSDADNPSAYLASCINMQELAERLHQSQAHHKAIVVDACFSGFAADAKGLSGHRYSPEALRRMVDEPGLVVMTAGDENQEAAGEDSVNGLSRFTRQLVDTLNRGSLLEGTFTAMELAENAAEKTRELSSKEQTPRYEVKYGSGQMLFFSTLDETAKPVESTVSLNRPGHKIGDTFTNPKDGSVLVWVPGGSFLSGDDTVNLDGFWMSKNDVTWGQYRRFCEETKHVLPPIPNFKHDDSHPVVGVTLQDARDYAGWAGAVVPSPQQWEKAARGADGREFPWGASFDAKKCRSSAKEKVEGTSPVGSFPEGASPYGCLDMAGNVWQWVDPGSDAGDGRISVRGGSWSKANEVTLRCGYIRFTVLPSSQASDLGFRIAGPVISGGDR